MRSIAIAALLATTPALASDADPDGTTKAADSKPADAKPAASSASGTGQKPLINEEALPKGQGDLRPAGRSMGLGVAIGAPVGLAGKLFFGTSSALSFNLGFWNTQYGALVLDYVIHPIGDIGAGSYGAAFLTLGGGLALGVGSVGGGGGFNGGTFGFYTLGLSPYNTFTPGNIGADVHATLGLGFAFAGPVDVFVEFSPGLQVLPRLDLGTRLTIGSRYYF